MQIDEAIELLEKTNIRQRADDIWAFQKEGNLSYDQRKAIKRYSCLLHDAAKIIEDTLAKLREVPKPSEPKLCICCEEITEENAHLHRNCGK